MFGVSVMGDQPAVMHKLVVTVRGVGSTCQTNRVKRRRVLTTRTGYCSMFFIHLLLRDGIENGQIRRGIAVDMALIRVFGN